MRGQPSTRVLEALTGFPKNGGSAGTLPQRFVEGVRELLDVARVTLSLCHPGSPEMVALAVAWGPDVSGETSFGTSLTVPLLVDGWPRGALEIADLTDRVFDARELRMVRVLADQAALTIDATSHEITWTYEPASGDRWEILQATLEHLSQGVSVIDRDLRLCAWNTRFLDLLGFPREFGQVGKAFVDFVRYNAARGEYGPGDPAQQVRERLALARRFEPHCFERTRPDGRVLEIRGTPMPGGGFVTTYTDVTERKRSGDALRQSEAHLRQAQKMEAVGRLAGGVAHDFNNLLTVITGRSEILLRMIGTDDPLRRHVDLIQQTAFRAADLTRQLLAFSRKQLLQPKVLDLNAVIEKVEGILRRLIGEHIELVSARDPCLGRVKADPGQIEQVIVNLAVNARDAMPQGGALTLETSNVELDETFVRSRAGARRGPHVRLAVADSGAGMDAETRAHIFEPFFTTKGPGKGTGLGLATVYGIVKQSDGYVWVESAPGQGTRFEIYLPRVEERADILGEVFAENGLPAGRETVLLVEDQDEVRDLAREVLQMIGYTVLEARHGREALAVVARHPDAIHLLLTDVVMPYMSGRELATQLAPLHPEMQVLYMSGYTDDAIVHHGVLDSGTAFLPKPFTADILSRRVREVLDGVHP